MGAPKCWQRVTMGVDSLESADGAKLRIARWPAARSPATPLVLLQGRSEYAEKYVELAGDLTAWGYTVWTMDWYGQGRSARPLADPDCHHVGDYRRYLDDLDSLIAHIAGKDGTPRVALAHSMGGHILLRHAAEGRHDWRAIAVSAPMVDIVTDPPRWLVALVTWVAARIGLARRYAHGQGPADSGGMVFEGNPLTRDPARFEAFMALTREDPDLRLGGVSWGWLDASFRSIRRLRREAGRLSLPTLIGLAGRDRIVDNTAIRSFADKAPGAHLIEYPDAEHELLMELDAVRQPFLDSIRAHFADAQAPTNQEARA
jgi:lysophospholipase